VEGTIGGRSAALAPEDDHPQAPDEPGESLTDRRWAACTATNNEVPNAVFLIRSCRLTVNRHSLVGRCGLATK